MTHLAQFLPKKPLFLNQGYYRISPYFCSFVVIILIVSFNPLAKFSISRIQGCQLVQQCLPLDIVNAAFQGQPADLNLARSFSLTWRLPSIPDPLMLWTSGLGNRKDYTSWPKGSGYRRMRPPSICSCKITIVQSVKNECCNGRTPLSQKCGRGEKVPGTAHEWQPHSLPGQCMLAKQGILGKPWKVSMWKCHSLVFSYYFQPPGAGNLGPRTWGPRNTGAFPTPLTQITTQKLPW